MTNAALTAQFLIDHYRPSAVIFSGIAGALDSTVRIGDIVICSTWVTHDYGYVGADGFEHHPVDVWSPGSDSIGSVTYVNVDSGLFAAAAALITDVIPFDSIGDRLPRVIAGGVGTSGNTFVDSHEKRAWLVEQFDGDIVDMESAAVAQVCTINNVPFLAVRSASDLAGGSGSSTARIEIREFFKAAAKNSSLVVSRLLESL
jgi:adenosylhomocysteine nucleosidase